VTSKYVNLSALADGETAPAGQTVADLVVVSGSTGEVVAWADITGKPATFAPAIGATSTTAVAGNDPRLSVGAAGTATVRALGTTATTACAGDDARLMTGDATAIADQATDFADLAAVTTAYNALLAELRDRGVLAAS
jgi:hypothetical protein